MPGANITSIEAIGDFRANLVVFLKKAQLRVDEVADEIRQTRSWVQSDQRVRWENEIRRRQRKLSQAEGELMTARMSPLRKDILAQLMAVRRAKEEAAEAEEKLRKVKHWTRSYESSLDPLAKKLESLRGVIIHEMPKATAYLARAEQTLYSYASSTGSQGSESTPPPLEGESAEPGPTSID